MLLAQNRSHIALSGLATRIFTMPHSGRRWLGRSGAVAI